MGRSAPPSQVALNPTVQSSAASRPHVSLARSKVQSPSASEQDVLAEPEHGQVGVRVAVDVERVGAGHSGEIARRRVQNLSESKGAANRAVVAIEGAGIGAARQVEVAAPVFVTVEHGDAASNEVLELAVIDMVDTRTLRLIDEMGRR